MNIVITGASKGIGLAVARKFAAETAVQHSFALCARNLAEIESTRDELRAEFPAHKFFASACDVSSESQVKSFSLFCAEHLGTTDVLVNNAGFGLFKQVTEFSTGEFRSVLNVNLRGVFLLTKELLPAMRVNKSGTIITISSLAGKNGFANGSAYCASKFAVRGFMQCLFLEVRADNIRCITICPGSVDTDFFQSLEHSPASARMLAASDVADTVFAATSLPLSATISEIDIRPTNPKG